MVTRIEVMDLIDDVVAAALEREKYRSTGNWPRDQNYIAAKRRLMDAFAEFMRDTAE